MNMSTYQKFIFYRTYSRWIPALRRRETFDETVDRYLDYIFSRVQNVDQIPEKVRRKAEAYIKNLQVMPSMRALWSAGENADKDSSVFYNCSFLAVDSLEAFGESLYLLACGCGVGYSVESKYVNQLPTVPQQKNMPKLRFHIPDSREGWKAALDYGVKQWFSGRDVDFDYNEVRPAGAPLVTSGGYASGPDPLRRCIEYTRETVLAAQGRKLTTLEVSDIMNEIASAIVVGGVRRSSQIALTDLDDDDMKTSKYGTFHPRRYMANISAVYNKKPNVLTFAQEFFDMAKSHTGERGLFNLYAAKQKAPQRRRKGPLVGTNPCKPLRSLILTPDGYITFEQALQKDSLVVIGGDGQKYKASKPFKTGESRPIYKLLLSNGSFLYGTEEHLHSRQGEWVRMDQLKVGDRLDFKSPVVYEDPYVSNDSSEFNLGLLAGWIHGDGSFRKREDREKGHDLTLVFGDHEFDVIPFFEKLLGKQSKPHHQKPDTCRVIAQIYSHPLIDSLLEHGYDYNKDNLEWLYGQSKSFKLGFIKAVFTADGSVRKNNNVELYSIRRSSLEVISNILREFGIYNTICVHNYEKSYIAKDGKVRSNKTTWKINVYAGQYLQLGFLSQRKNNLASERLVLKPIYRYKDYVRVVDIDPEFSIEDVYDITVYSGDHSFLDAGVVTHNCAEIVLRNMSFCNLTEVVVRPEDDEDTLRDKITTAVWLGTIQSCFTYFPELRPEWKKNCEEERLLGVSLTGCADNIELLQPEVLRMLKKHALKVARQASELMGINMPAAVTTIKPSGTVSQMCDCSSGMHSRWSEYYIRRVRISAHDPLLQMMRDQGFEVKPAPENNDTYVLEFPIKAPEGCKTTREDTALGQLEWYKTLVGSWCEHNASCTVYVKDNEWLDVTKWVYDNFDIVNGVSFFPYEDHTYECAPYEEIDAQTYHDMVAKMPVLDFSQLPKYEDRDLTTGHYELACTGNACEFSSEDIDALCAYREEEKKAWAK